MQVHKLIGGCAIVAAALAGLTSCGGGGGGAASVATTASTTVALTGTAAVGAPMSGATVTLKSRNGTIQTVTAGADGSFSFSPFDPASHPAPYVIVATGTVGETQESLVAAYATAENAVVNVTPISHAIVATLTNGNPHGLANDVNSLAANITKTALETSEQGFRAALGSNITAIGVSGGLVNTAFSSALDKLLDNVRIEVKPDGTIEMSTLAGAMVDDLGNSGATPASAKTVVLAKGVIPTEALKADLPAPNAAAVIGIDMLDLYVNTMNACFKQSSANRGTWLAPLGACNVRVTLNSPTYKNEGLTAIQQFNGLLTSPAMDNAVFYRPEILRQLAADRAQVKLVWKRADGVFGNIVTVAQKDSDGLWRLVGNQRDFETFINGVVSRRVSVNGLTTGRYETGFNLYVRDNATISQVVVTGPGLPAGGVKLKRRGGCDFLALVDGANTSHTCASYYRVRANTLAGAVYTPASPFEYLFASPNLTDAQIAAIVPSSLYKFEITKTDTSVVTYWNRLRSRPYTIDEAAKVNYIDLVSKGLLTTGSIYSGGGRPLLQWQNHALGAPAYNVGFLHDAGSDLNNFVPHTQSSLSIPCIGNANCVAGNNYGTIASPLQNIFMMIGRNRYDTQIFSMYAP